MSGKLKILAVIILISILGCNEEDENLVNPPGKYLTVQFRFLNLGLDGNTKSLRLLGGIESDAAAPGQLTKSMQPSSDSTYLSVVSNGNIEHDQEQLIRFIRNSNYTFIGMTKLPCENKPACNIDTVLTVRTTTAIPDNSLNGYVRLLNAMPDSTTNYSIKLGCPNGPTIIPNVRYMTFNLTAATIRRGITAVSLVKNTQGQTGSEEFIDLFELDLEEKKQYLLVVMPDANGDETLKMIKEDDLTENAMIEVPIVQERNTNLRVINFSSGEASLRKTGYGTLETALPRFGISDFNAIETCGSTEKDTLEVFSGGQNFGKIPVSLEVLKDYTFVIIDSDSGDGKTGMLIEPYDFDIDISGKAKVRVVHASKNGGGVTVSLGARLDPGQEGRNYSSGLALAAELTYAELSEPVAIDPGPAPINVFTSTQPAYLRYCGLNRFEADKSYIILITDTDEGGVGVSIVEDSDESMTTGLIDEGVFLTVVNADKEDGNTVSVNYNSALFGDILSDARIYYTSSLSTVVEPGQQSVTINGQSYNFEAGPESRVMLVATGQAQSEVFSSVYPAVDTATYTQSVRFRYMNAAPDIQQALIKDADVDTLEAFTQVNYGEFTEYFEETRDKRLGQYVYDGFDANYVHVIGGITLTLGKGYTIIFTGYQTEDCRKFIDRDRNIEPDCYSVIIQQEF
jgi:hypothetical protein